MVQEKAHATQTLGPELKSHKKSARSGYWYTYNPSAIREMGRAETGIDGTYWTQAYL